MTTSIEADRRRARRAGAAGARRPSSCSTAARPCRSSPATARRPPGCSTTPSCARWRSGCATCGSWRSGAPRSWSRSRSQGKLDDALEAQILAADSKARLEDIYLPYKPKRRTKAQIAREAGLEPLADGLLGDPTRGPAGRRRRVRRRRQGRRRRRRRAGRRPGDPGRAVRRGRRPDRRAARADVGARAGWSPRCARARRRRAPSSPTTSTSPSRSPSCPRTGSWRCSAARRRRSSTSPWSRRSRSADAGPTSYERRIAAPLRHRRPRAARPTSGWPTPCAGPGAPAILVHLGIDLRMRLWQAAEDEAVRVFAANLRDLLLAAPGRHPGHDGPRPGLPHRREGRRGRRHRQGGRHRHDLPARAARPVGRVAGHAGPAGHASTASS